MHIALLLTTLLSAAPIPGTYDDLVLGYDPDAHRVTGFFYSGRDQTAQGKPAFVCTFFFEGQAEGDHFAIKSYAPGASEAIEGTLSVPAPRSVAIHLEQEHGGCFNVRHFADADPATFQLGTIRAWHGIRVVQAERAYFHAEPPEAPSARPAKGKKAAHPPAVQARVEPAQLASYLSRGDPVAVLDSRSGWIKVEFAGKKPLSGWLREEDLFPLH